MLYTALAVDLAIGSLWVIFGIGLVVLLAYRMSRIERELSESRRILGQNLTEIEGANSKLQDVDDLKDRVLGQVSHELRTPLAAIASAASAAKHTREPVPTTVRDFIDAIIRETHRMTAMEYFPIHKCV